MTRTTIEKLIEKHRLQPHPEGGYYREVYKSDCLVRVTDKETGNDDYEFAVTSILFLVPADDVSKLHRIKYDELWFHHEGDTVNVVVLDNHEEEGFKELKLGQSEDDKLQHVVKGCKWFGCYLEPGQHGYALVSCVVAPGFNFRDFEMGDRDKLLNDYPQAKRIIEKLTLP